MSIKIVFSKYAQAVGDVLKVDPALLAQNPRGNYDLLRARYYLAHTLWITHRELGITQTVIEGKLGLKFMHVKRLVEQEVVRSGPTIEAIITRAGELPDALIYEFPECRRPPRKSLVAQKREEEASKKYTGPLIDVFGHKVKNHPLLSRRELNDRLWATGLHLRDLMRAGHSPTQTEYKIGDDGLPRIMPRTRQFESFSISSISLCSEP